MIILPEEKKVKRVSIDIETSHITTAGFGLFPKYIPHENILKDWHIICARWKWEGEDEIYGEKTYTSNDKKVVKALRDVVMEADELVYHNGKKFDYKKLNTRVLMHGLPPMDKPRETDTLTQCRKHFAFTSNRLDYIAKVLLGEGKMTTTPGLWLRALDGDREAIDEMYEYCGIDVLRLEQVFQKIRSHIDVGFNANMLDNSRIVCHNCGSSNTIKEGWRTTKTAKYQKYRCKDCLSWSYDGKAEKRLEPARRK